MDPTDLELCAYLDEMLAVQRAAEIERLLRDRADLRQRAALLAQRRDQGGHTVGEIWRREQLSCPTRHQLGTFLLGAAAPDYEDYINFHLSMIGCRVCQANLEDLKSSLQSKTDGSQIRQRRYFESSAGLLRSRHEE